MFFNISKQEIGVFRVFSWSDALESSTLCIRCFRGKYKFPIICYYNRLVSDYFWEPKQDFNQNLVVIQMEIVSLHTDNKFVEPAYESPLIVSDRAVYLAKNS